MPLSEKARIEVFLPDHPDTAYHNLPAILDQEFTYSFGGCSIIRGLQGSYLSHSGLPISDRINLIFTDTPLTLNGNLEKIGRYGERLRKAIHDGLPEEAILVVIVRVFHVE